MRAAIRLYNSKTHKAVDTMLNNSDMNILYIVDGNDKKWGQIDEHSGLMYVSPYRFLDDYNNGKVDKVLVFPYLGAKTSLDVLDEMKDMGVREDAFAMPPVPALEYSGNAEKSILDYSVKDFRTLHRLQYHITDHCNYKCVSCSHFSSLVDGEEFISVEQVKNDLLSLKRIVRHIDVIDILGGEPLLNPEWKEFVKITKEIYPFSDITIITNGSVLNKLDEKDWDCIRDNNVCIRVSLYRPFWKNADEVAFNLKNKGIKYSVNTRVISKFAANFLKEPCASKEKNRLDCRSECFQLYKGRMAPCSRMMYIRYFNAYWNVDYPDEVPVQCIEDVDSFGELINLLNKPMRLCAYCNPEVCSQVSMEWEMMKPGKDNNSIDKWIL